MEDTLYNPQYIPSRSGKVDYRVQWGGEEETHPEVTYRIKTWMAACLIAVTVLIDIIQALLTLVVIGAVLSPIITVGATFLFWLWFKMLGISYTSNPKQLATFTIQSFGELIPVIDVLPLWTIGIILTIIITRSEDKGGIIGKAANLVPLPKK